MPLPTSGPELADRKTYELLSRGETLGWSLRASDGPSPDDPPGSGADPTAADPPVFPRPGAVLAGFRLLSELGRGAFARVYLAEQADLANRQVALKVAPALGDEPQRLARLQHTHIVPIHSVHDDLATGLRLLCMPYLGGANLADVLNAAGNRLPSLVSGRSLVEALDAACAGFSSGSAAGLLFWGSIRFHTGWGWDFAC